MERPRAGSDHSSNSSKTSSIPARFKKYFKKTFNSSVRKETIGWENDAVTIRPSNTRRCLIPDRRVKYGPTDEEYNTNHKTRGRVYIFNHLNFKKDKVPAREGTMTDVENLRKSLPKLGFRPKDIVCFQDLSVSEIEERLEEISTEDHSNSDMVIIFILTHGQKDGKIYAHDRDYAIQEIWDHFTADKCKTLVGKPKIFFIIACRGQAMDDGTIVSQPRKLSVTEIDSVRCKPSVSYRIPIWADFLTVYSTAEGYYSYRHPNDGTWYIQSLCSELNNFSESYMHFTDFLTRVNRNVAIAYQTLFDDSRFNNKKQCPFMTSSLTKVLYLKIASNQTRSDDEVKHKPRPKSMNT